MSDMKKPKKAKGTRKKITTKNPPGGSETPGAKAMRERQTTDKANGR